MRQQAGAASPLCRPYFKRNTGISGKQRVLFPRNALREPIELAVYWEGSACGLYYTWVSGPTDSWNLTAQSHTETMREAVVKGAELALITRSS